MSETSSPENTANFPQVARALQGYGLDAAEEALPLKARVQISLVASCSCGTKTPEVRYHHPLCRYRILSECWNKLADEPGTSAGEEKPKDSCELCKGERGGVPGNENLIEKDGRMILVCDYCHAQDLLQFFPNPGEAPDEAVDICPHCGGKGSVITNPRADRFSLKLQIGSLAAALLVSLGYAAYGLRQGHFEIAFWVVAGISASMLRTGWRRLRENQRMSELRPAA